ncbi:MAG: ParA family protein [Planctomycetota bacterium]
MRSLAVANQKGGVGKTTTAIHLAHGLAMAGARVLLIDLDPQGNATLAVQSMQAEPSVTEGPLSWMRPLADGLWMLPSPGAEAHLARDATLETDKLAATIEELDQEIDWLVVDCPPRMDQWGWAGLRICDEVLVPVQAEFFAMQGLSQMMRTLEAAQQEFPGRAQMLGVVVTMLDVREPVSVEVLGDLRETLGARLMDSVIFRDSQLVEAASHGISIFEYNLQSKAALAYAELVREIMHG